MSTTPPILLRARLDKSPRIAHTGPSTGPGTWTMTVDENQDPPKNAVGALEQVLRSRIAKGEWTPGTRLPSERALAHEYGISHSTVKRALGFLHREGMLVGYRGKGHFVAGRPTRHVTRNIAVVMSHSDDMAYPTMAQVFDGMREVIHGRDYNLNLMAARSHRLPPRPLAELFGATPIIDVAAADAAIVLGLPDGNEEPLYTLARHLPVCATGHFLHGPGVGCVRVDFEIGTVRALGHLRALGHRHVAVYAPDDRNASGRRQRDGAAIAAVAYDDLRVDVVEVDEYEESEGARAGRHWWASRPRPTAVVLGSDELTAGFVPVARGKGVSIPRGLSVVSWNDSLPTERFDLAFTALRYDGRLQGRLAAECVFSMLECPQAAPPTRHVPVELAVRASTAAPDGLPT